MEAYMIQFSVMLIFIGLFVFAFYGVARLAETLFPDRPLPPSRHWRLRVAATTAMELCVVAVLGLLLKDWWQLPSIWDWGQTMSPLAGGALAYFCASFIFYWWHRARHQSDFLWLTFHQLHHSPQRLETLTTFYKHPAEVVANSLLSSVLTYLVFGLAIEGAAMYTAITICAQFAVHVNVRTPRWLGYFFQRPEMHRLHHEYDRHRNNYGDIVFWDMLFGTYKNPRVFQAPCGFDSEREQRLLDMLVFRDVHKKISASSPNN
jgi:sterol desaturase/sphingolipid hydroxylase (fatty acid hydroxylase superfamily)